MKRQTAIRIDQDLWDWFRQYCKGKGMTVTGYITSIIVSIQEKDEKKKIISKGGGK